MLSSRSPHFSRPLAVSMARGVCGVGGKGLLVLISLFVVLSKGRELRRLRGGRVTTERSAEKAVLIPDTATIDSAALGAVGADKFLSLWFIFVLGGATEITGEMVKLWTKESLD